MTTEHDAAMAARVEGIRARREAALARASATAGDRPRPTKRRHPALGSRIASAGLGAAAMIAIATVLEVATPATAGSSTAVAPPSTPPPTPIHVVVHHIPAPTNPSDGASVPAETVRAPGPIELTATPVVKTVTVAVPAPAAPARTQRPAPAPAPAATTSGSS